MLNHLLQNLNEKDNEELFWIQSYYSEQEVLETLIKLAELNFYKSARVEERAVDFLGKSNFRILALRAIINDHPPDDEMRSENIVDECSLKNEPLPTNYQRKFFWKFFWMYNYINLLT